MKRFFLVILLGVIAVVGYLLIDNLAEDRAEQLYDGRRSEFSVDVDSFTGIELDFPAEIYYTTGGPSMRVEAPTNLRDQLKVNQQEGNLQLTISSRIHRYKGKSRVDIYLSSERLNSININGVGKLTSKSSLKTDQLRIVVNGIGEVEMDGVVADMVSCHINGSGEISINDIETHSLQSKVNGMGVVEFEGVADNVVIEINGTGKADIEDLRFNNHRFTINGLGKIKQ